MERLRSARRPYQPRPAAPQTGKGHGCIPGHTPQSELGCMRARTFHIRSSRPKRQATAEQQLAKEGSRGRRALHPFLVHRVVGGARRGDRGQPRPLCLWDKPVQPLTQQHGVHRDEKMGPVSVPPSPSG